MDFLPLVNGDNASILKALKQNFYRIYIRREIVGDGIAMSFRAKSKFHSFYLKTIDTNFSKLSYVTLSKFSSMVQLKKTVGTIFHALIRVDTVSYSIIEEPFKKWIIYISFSSFWRYWHTGARYDC